MKSILTDLWNGKIIPSENLAPNTPEFLAHKQKLLHETASFKSTLSADDIERFERLEETSSSLSNMYHTEAFIRGFRLALKIMVEVYSGKDELPDILKLLGIGEPEK